MSEAKSVGEAYKNLSIVLCMLGAVVLMGLGMFQLEHRSKSHMEATSALHASLVEQQTATAKNTEAQLQSINRAICNLGESGKAPPLPAERLLLLQKLAEVEKQHIDEQSKVGDLILKIALLRQQMDEAVADRKRRELGRDTAEPDPFVYREEPKKKATPKITPEDK